MRILTSVKARWIQEIGCQLLNGVPISTSIASGKDSLVDCKKSVSREEYETIRLLLVLYEAGSRQNREIEADLAMGVIPTIGRLQLEESITTSTANDIEDLDLEFAAILNLNEGTRAGADHAVGYSHVGKADPSVNNLGASWVLSYNSITGLNPVNRAANGLKGFYQNITNIAAGKIANATEPVKFLDFVSHGLSLRLTSKSPISWEWIIRFARLMSYLAESHWAVLYNSVAKSSYWNVATIFAVLIAL
ncbi:MAG: hypothetical protein Q9220_001507 [cf. Caloplaca sp. 1 TL-2023]